MRAWTTWFFQVSIQLLNTPSLNLNTKKKKSVEKCDSSSWLMDRVEEGNQIYISEKKNERGLKSRAFIYIRSHA